MDQLLENEVKQKIRTKHLSAKEAFKIAIQNYIDTLSQVEDDYLKERIHDVSDLSERLYFALEQKIKQRILEPIILVVDVLYPSYLFEYEPYVQGVIVKEGSNLSHGVILAKERNIPVMVVKDTMIEPNQYVFIDGNRSKLIINPSNQEVEGWLKSQSGNDPDLQIAHHPKRLCLNVSGETLIDPRYVEAADGIGLYRSEFLYFQKNMFPSIDKQVEIYGQFLKQFHPKPVVIRTYDFGDDKNPLNLGPLQRGVSDYFMTYEKPFVEQLSALLVLNETYNNLKIMIPMVKNKADLDAVQQLLEKLHHKFGFTRPLPPLGVMIETEEAFMNLSDFTKAAFFSIGSNDLGKSLFHFDRSRGIDEQTYANQMVKAIEEIDQFAKHHQIPCTFVETSQVDHSPYK
jgi:phosphoenolpyruvate-protein kinase (PTS system EI component)